MKILVLGGSPKGETSVTMQYVRWIAENLPNHEVRTLQIASRIGALERDDGKFAQAIEAVNEADAVLWAFPLYVFTVCSQYKRFIELIRERGVEGSFAGKYAASLSTSIHFFDNTAHQYIREVSEDLGMAFTGSFSPKMDDLRKGECRRQLLVFAQGLARAAEERLPMSRRSAPLPMHKPPLASVPEGAGIADGNAGSEAGGKKTLVLVDYPELAVGAMARRFAGAVSARGTKVEILALEEMGMKGGCLGCLKCGQANRCAYEGKDGFIDAFRSKVATADLLVFAGTTRDRALSARWKAFLDRAFFNTHQAVLRGKQFLFIVSGPLSRLDNLRQTLTGYVEWQGGNLVDFVSDEVDTGPELDALPGRRGGTLRHGARLWRDEARHLPRRGRHEDLPRRYLRRASNRLQGGPSGLQAGRIYDFPQRHPLKRIAVWLGYWITSIPAVYRGMIRDFPAFMIMPYKSIFAKKGSSPS